MAMGMSLGEKNLRQLLGNRVESAEDVGTATAAAAGSLTDATKEWPVNGFKGCWVEIDKGTGFGQFRKILSNTVTQLNIDAVWTVTPDTSSVYSIKRIEADIKLYPSTTLIATLAIGDALEHASAGVDVSEYQEKAVLIQAIAAGGVAPLEVWVELSYVDLPANYAPLATPEILVVTGDALIAWTMHSDFARVVAQIPLWAIGNWTVTATLMAATK